MLLFFVSFINYGRCEKYKTFPLLSTNYKIPKFRAAREATQETTITTNKKSSEFGDGSVWRRAEICVILADSGPDSGPGTLKRHIP